MKILITEEDFNEMEFRFKKIKPELLHQLYEISKLDAVRLYIIDIESNKQRRLNIDENLAYSADPQ